MFLLALCVGTIKVSQHFSAEVPAIILKLNKTYHNDNVKNIWVLYLS